jgi:outer membrane receptor protein involved in Fe transport
MGNNLKLQYAIRAAIAAAAASATPMVMAATPAPSASSADTLEEVIVTGSRLSQSPNDVSISPVTTITQAEIQQTGLVRTEDLLNNLPQVTAENGSGQSISSDGTATVSLRQLGSWRTLALINGRRMNPSAGLNIQTSQSDINAIPASLIERVDVLTGGASSVYGADAVAGVVNFVLNTHFEGVKVDANYGYAMHNNNDKTLLGYLSAAGQPAPKSTFTGGQNRDFSIVIGSNFADGKGNATAYATYLNTSPVVGNQYDYAGCTLNTPSAEPLAGKALKCGGSSSSATGRFLEFGRTTYTTGTSHGTTHVTTTGFGLHANHTVDKTTGNFRGYTAADSYNYGGLSYLQRQAERYTVGGFLNYDVNEHTNVYSETMWSRNTSTAQYGASGLFAFGTPVISCSNPLFNASELAVLCTPDAIARNQWTFGPNNGANFPLGGNPRVTGDNILLYAARRSVESGPRLDNYGVDSIREVLGAKGKFNDAWSYDVYGQAGISTLIDVEGGFLGTQQIDRALDVIPDPDTGEAVCRSKLNGADPACVPWNIWTPGGVTQAQLDYLTVQSSYTVRSTEYIMHGDLTGDLGKYGLKLPSAAGGLMVNVGAEYREEKYDFDPDYIFSNGFASGGNGVFKPFHGGFHVHEIFTEMRLPLVDEKPGFYQLSTEAGYRYSDYSSGYKTDTFKFGVEWAPIKDLRIRTGYNRAVRAPSVGDLFAPTVIGAGGTADPCWGTADANGLVNGHDAAFCANTGVTAAEFGHILANPAAQINTSVGGNTKLIPEVADTFTFGLVAQPSFVPGLVLSVDYYDIKIDKTIQSLTSNTVINNCGITGDPTLCGLIHRGGGTGSLWFNVSNFVDTNEINVGTLHTKGIDLAGHYQHTIGTLGKLAFNLTGTLTDSFLTQPLDTGPSYDCVGYFGTTCNAPTPKWRHVLATNWSTPWSGLDVTLRWRYLGKVASDRTSSDPQLAQAYLPSTSFIEGYSYFDLSVAMPLGKSGLDFRLGVNNITDKDPPIIANGNFSDCPNSSCNDNTWVGTYDTLGRYFYAHASVKF